MILPLAMSRMELLACGLICGLGVLLAIGYLLVSRTRSGRYGIWQLESDEAFATRMRRRQLGAALLGAISLAFFIGAAVLQPTRWPSGFVLYWLIVLLMLAWLLGLGLADLLQTRRMVNRSRRRKRNDR